MCSEMGQCYDAMTADMGKKLSGYYVGLQSRFGDPRVYAAQRNEMLAQEARVVHSNAGRTAELLREAYANKQKHNRVTHEERMVKLRAGRSAASRPESAAETAPRQTAQPVKPQPSAQSGESPSVP